MKKIFTFLVLICFTWVIGFGQQGSAKIRLHEVIPDQQVAVQIRLGNDVMATPGPGTTICTASEATDTLITDINFTIIWPDGVNASLVVENLNNAGFPYTGDNSPACALCFVQGDLLAPYGGGYGIAANTPGSNGGFNYQIFNAQNPCAGGEYWVAPFKWQTGQWYTVATISANIAPGPPGSEPLALINTLQIAPDGSISGQAPNIGIVAQFNFNEITPAVNGSVLPLELLSFDALKEGDKSAALTWTTANEVDTKLFVIQRSGNSKEWNDIGSVEAAVNNAGIKQYHFLDKNVYTGRKNREAYYYRLKMIDQDDSYDYSNIDVVSFTSFLNDLDGFKLYMYPNPATSGVNVEIGQPADGDQITELQLFDVTGKMVFSRDIAPGSELEYIDFARQNMVSGTYVLRAIDAANVAQAHEKLVVLR